MKKIIVMAGAILILLIMGMTTTAEEKFKPQKFDVTFKVKYQDKTLREIAEIEELIKTRNSKACSVKIEEIERGSDEYFQTGTTASSSSFIYQTTTPRVEVNERAKTITIQDSKGYQINTFD